MKRALPLLLLVSCASEPRTQWWTDAKYGMFIHWGVYAVPARGEWVMHHEKIPVAEYEKFAPQFRPDRYDSRAWAKLAKDAGMKYVVITSKHHDGYAMYRTKYDDWHIDAEPLKDLAAACRAEELRFGVYYSILDWHDPNPKTKLKVQLREIVDLVDPDVLWFDGEWEDWWIAADGDDLERFVREIAPRAVVNNRVGKRGPEDGDYETPEQEIPARGYPRLWETCMTVNGSWGYHAQDRAWKSPREVIRMLVDIVAKGGNFLLNVGPTAQGVIPEESAKILREVGAWLSKNGEAIYGTRGLIATSWGGITHRGDRLYAIILEGDSVDLPIAGPIRSARRLDGTPVRFEGTRIFASGVVVVDAEPRIEAKPIAPDADGTITLLAKDAILHGSVRVEYRHPKGNVGFWTSPDDTVEWDVQADGDYEVELTYSAAPGAGGEFTIGALSASVGSTGGWDRFRTIRLGRLSVARRLVVKPVHFSTALMNLAAIRLLKPDRDCVFYVTTDGLRPQEFFEGAENEKGTPEERRALLLPFVWNVIAKEGQIYRAKITNTMKFSYPGYHELLAGWADPAIDSNAKKPNPNVTVLEWLNRRPGLENRVAAFGTWDVLPFILNRERSGLHILAADEPISGDLTEREKAINELRRDIPDLWPGNPFDAFTMHAAIEHIRRHKPRVVYILLGETDEWAHAGDYKQYLAAARRADRFLQTLWDLAQSMPEYRGRTSIVFSTDHGRGSGKEWTSHGQKIAGAEEIWIALLGPRVAASGVRPESATQAQLAATVAALVGEDWPAAEPRAAKPLNFANDR